MSNATRRQTIHQAFVREIRVKAMGLPISAVEAVFHKVVSDDSRAQLCQALYIRACHPQDAGRRNKAEVKGLSQTSTAKMPWQQKTGRFCKIGLFHTQKIRVLFPPICHCFLKKSKSLCQKPISSNSDLNICRQPDSDSRMTGMNFTRHIHRNIFL